LHQFNGADGGSPVAKLVQANSGDLYGTTSIGGPLICDDILDVGCGTIFKITLGGTLTSLHNFCTQPGCTDGYYPNAALIQASDGNLYGSTSQGGACSRCGTIFKMMPDGVLTTLYRFRPI
jgi:uncharacterized repeat protein (TIGR03803 family)